jgi:hypothetical protein
MLSSCSARRETLPMTILLDQAGSGADQINAPLPPSHRLDESQPVIPRQVALQQSPLPLHQPVPSSLRPAATVNRDRTKAAGFTTGLMQDFQPVLTESRGDGETYTYVR